MSREHSIVAIAGFLALVFFWSVMRNTPDRAHLRRLRRNRADLRRALHREK